MRQIARDHSDHSSRRTRLGVNGCGLIAWLAIAGCSGPPERTIEIEAEPPKVVTEGIDGAPHGVGSDQEKPPTTVGELPAPVDPKHGLPTYPGAKKVSDETKGVVRVLVFETPDRPDDVIDFYRPRVNKVIGEAAVGPTSTLEGESLNEHYTIVAMRLGNTTQVEIRIEYSP